jgi:mono/diheme cytochrome c family protein
MNKSLKRILIVACILVLAAACERHRTETAKSGQNYQSPVEYSEESGVKLTTLPGDVHVASVAFQGEGAPLDGEALYVANCVACHQINGKGVPAAFPPLDGSPYVTGDKLERMAAIMIYGLQGPIKVLGQDYNGVMAPLGRLKDAELAAIATYIRGAWSNTAGAVDAKVFEETRAKYGTRSMFNISELGEES